MRLSTWSAGIQPRLCSRSQFRLEGGTSHPSCLDEILNLFPCCDIPGGNRRIISFYTGPILRIYVYSGNKASLLKQQDCWPVACVWRVDHTQVPSTHDAKILKYSVSFITRARYDSCEVLQSRVYKPVLWMSAPMPFVIKALKCAAPVLQKLIIHAFQSCTMHCSLLLLLFLREQHAV